MSEIKGQLLGIVLVIAVFGAIAGVLYAAFTTSAESVKTKMNITDIETNAGIKGAPKTLLTFQE